MSGARIAFVFVCQAGELEIKSLLLAASLRRVLGATAELIAAVPTPAQTWGEPAADTCALLDALDVRRAAIVNPIDPQYPIGNKLACFGVGTRAPTLVFLDSDMLCLRDPGDSPWLQAGFAAKPADLRTFAAAPEAWQPLYAAAGVALPRLRLPTTVSGEFGPPYFNSGVVAAANHRDFGAAWIDCARAIDADLVRREQRHWLDQVALPIAMQRIGSGYAALDERFNYPAHLKPLGAGTPFFCHYHWPRIIALEPRLHAVVHELAAAHPALLRIAGRDSEWAALLAVQPAAAVRAGPGNAAAPAARDLLILEIPGSGAHRLVRLLELRGARLGAAGAAGADALLHAQQPWEFAAALRATRNNGAAAAHDGVVVAQCADAGALCRIAALQRVAAAARTVVCVDDPFTTIAEWKTWEPGRLDTELARALGVAAHWLPLRAVEDLRRIVTLDDAAEKRAAAWWWFAQRVLEANAVTIVRADEFAGADRLVARLLAGEPAGARQRHSAPPARGLDASDRQAIAAICLQPAMELGVID